MAARENQGLQIALIVCAMLTVALAVTSFVFYNSTKEETIRAASAVKDAMASKETLTKAVEETNQLKQLMGYAATIDVPTAVANFKKDVEQYAASMRESEQNYRNIVAQLSTELQKKSELVVDAETRNQQLQNEFQTKEKANLASVEEYQAGLKQAKDDLEQELKKFNADRDKSKKEKSELVRKFESKEKDSDELLAKNSKEQDATVSKLQDTLRTVDALLSKAKSQEISTELSDGKVTWVNQHDRTVWVNLGSDDGLRRQISFSVVGADELKLMIPKPKEGDDIEARRGNVKGSIEITRILDHHLAEARIMDDDPSKPIMPGDQLFSTAWRPGQAEHFALVGLLDLDHDGSSDLHRVEEMITVNGGVIDAELKDDGSRVGKMNVDTRYLVLGSEPTEKAPAEYIANFSKMIAEAKALPIRTIPIEDLILYLGYKDRERTVPLGKDAKASDFPARAPSDVPRRSHNESFKNRRDPIHNRSEKLP
jgi:hypothetical protein